MVTPQIVATVTAPDFKRRVEALRQEAATAGDFRQVHLCRLAQLGCSFAKALCAEALLAGEDA